MGQMMGYARVSTPEQDVSLQRDALHQVGCREEHVFLAIASGARTARPGLAACLQALAPGDTLVVWRLDRLRRSMAPLVPLIDELLRRQIRFRSLCDGGLSLKFCAKFQGFKTGQITLSGMPALALRRDETPSVAASRSAPLRQ